MLQPIERLAELSIARGCGFAALGIFTMMVGLSFDLALALKAGGIAALFASAVLAFKGANALRRSYKHTEVWVILPKEERPRPEVAQQLIGNALREVCFRFAQQAALLSALMLAMAIVIALAR